MPNRLRLLLVLSDDDLRRWRALADRERLALKQAVYEAMQTAVARGTVR